MKTAIMTDTNSGITKNNAEKLGIYVIHMPVIIDETTFYENDTITEASVTMYESVLHAREMSLNGASAKEIKTALESDAYNSSIYITVNTLEYPKIVSSTPQLPCPSFMRGFRGFLFVAIPS